MSPVSLRLRISSVTESEPPTDPPDAGAMIAPALCRGSNTMNIRKAICFLILMTAAAIQPALAAPAHAPKPVAGADPMQIVDVPAKGVAAEKTIQTTPRDDV